jgi:hypothetical protein
MEDSQHARILDRVEVRPGASLDGLWLGLLSGLVFGLTAWGIDAVALGNASVDHPWDKLAMGLVFSLLTGGIAGWLTAVIDRAAAGLILWACAGIAYAWLAGHIPFDGLSALLRMSEPRLGEIVPYPFVASARVRTAFLMFVIGGLSAMGGTLELVLLDRARDAQSALGRAISIGLIVPFFVLAGVAADGIINRPLRDPLVAVDRVIGWAVDAQANPIDPTLARQRHLGAVSGIENLLGRPYRMSMGAYDPASLYSFSVEVDFDGAWVRCSVLASVPGYCRETDSTYESAIPCLLRGGQDCGAAVAGSAQPWIDQSAARNEVPASVRVLDHFAAVVLVDVSWPDGRRDVCIFRGVQPITLARCTPAAD